MANGQKRKRGREEKAREEASTPVKSDEYDLVIRCQGRAFKTHKAIVRTASAPFAAMVDGPFLVSNSQIVSGVRNGAN